ncbi:L,D-transpeptidase family protein [uncultured Thiocystis sp.]|jgi:murein L,D-transpeptidase YafK|uniref:L,D-transpeptidase family protein n=1 Tax=uncultured Thiocystis sp. TaxID=1202134 RepID=UPI0025FC0EC4|nr:L,D-transpeptidase family protein [uncultured Thiocystis sp.]
MGTRHVLLTAFLLAILLAPTAPAMSFLPTFDLPQSTANKPPEFRPPNPSMADRVVVKKAERRLYLMRGDQPLRTYPIALGFRPEGPKRLEGDGRTPEGRYVLERRNPRSSYRKSLHLSYPNARDRLRAHTRGGRPGGMIMIHGQPNAHAGGRPREGDWTFGCIAVSNPAIDEIWSLTADGTPIEILP